MHGGQAAREGGKREGGRGRKGVREARRKGGGLRKDMEQRRKEKRREGQRDRRMEGWRRKGE